MATRITMKSNDKKVPKGVDNYILARESKNGVNCVWRYVTGSSFHPTTGKQEVDRYFLCSYDWSALKKDGVVGLQVELHFRRHIFVDFAVVRGNLTHRVPTLQVKLPLTDDFHSNNYSFTSEIVMIRENVRIALIESMFASSDETNAVLEVDGKKMHVNKELLSYHSGYFRALFTSSFKENSMEVIPIGDVNYEEFATLLSLVQQNPITPTDENAAKLLELADRFLMPAASRHIENYLIISRMSELSKVVLADKHNLKDLLDSSISSLSHADVTRMTGYPSYENLSANTKTELFHRLMCAP